MKPKVIGAWANARPDHAALPAPRPTAPAALINSRRFHPDCVIALSLFVGHLLVYKQQVCHREGAFGRPGISKLVHWPTWKRASESYAHHAGTSEVQDLRGVQPIRSPGETRECALAPTPVPGCTRATNAGLPLV